MRKFVVNEAFGILALTILLIPQVAHTVYVFKVNSHYSDPWFAWCYAVGVDLAILIFTVKGWTRTAIVYFLGTLCHNLVYQFWPESAWSAALVCLMLSGTILSFSHLFFQQVAPNRTASAEEVQNTAAAEQLSAARAAGIRFEIKPYLCPECEEAFTSSKKLNGHVSGHKQKDEWFPDNYGAWEAKNEERAAFAALVQFDVSPNINNDDDRAD